MKGINYNLQNFLPLNRKERFYTGTVFPQIICYDNFRYIERFFKLIEGFPENLEIDLSMDNSNFQLFTEYSLNESANRGNFSRKYENVPETKETPDLIILITAPEKYLIVAEAKMFSNLSFSDFEKQLLDQKKMIQCIKENIFIKEENIFHLGIVPQRMFSKDIASGFQIISWEDILYAYNDILKENYFFELLNYAVNNYGSLKSQSPGSSYGMNMETKMSGIKIMQLIDSGKKFIVGRGLGLKGKNFQTDIGSGGWKEFNYEVNFSNTRPINRNWFTSDEFKKEISKHESKTITNKREEEETDVWHFKYLGKNFFENIAGLTCKKYSLDVPIRKIYIGKTGEPFYLIEKGRNVSPNWFVILEDGRKFRKKQYRKNEIEEGEYNPSKCFEYDWEDIKKYFEG